MSSCGDSFREPCAGGEAITANPYSDASPEGAGAQIGAFENETITMIERYAGSKKTDAFFLHIE